MLLSTRIIPSVEPRVDITNPETKNIILVREEPKTTVTVPEHKELDRGTLRASIRQVGLSVDEFVELLTEL